MRSMEWAKHLLSCGWTQKSDVVVVRENGNARVSVIHGPNADGHWGYEANRVAMKPGDGMVVSVVSSVMIEEINALAEWLIRPFSEAEMEQIFAPLTK